MFGGSMFGSEGFETGRWDTLNVTLPDGKEGSGPLCVFDITENAVVISPLNHFMSASVYHDHKESLGSEDLLYWGVIGDVENIPSGFEYQTIMYYSSLGINKAFEGWGQLLRKYHGRTDKYLTLDPTLKYLGYYMDYGSFYYHNVDPVTSYQGAILHIKEQMDKKGIPVQYIQYDNWRYSLDRHAVTSWESTPYAFPNGSEFVYRKTGYPVVAQNGFWSSRTPYASTNGGNFSFLIENDLALPQTKAFWKYLFSSAKQWGLSVYQQDWLDKQYLSMDSLHSDLDLGRQWLLQMGQAAEESDLFIQYTAALPRQAMASLEIPAVTQARVTGDYHLKTAEQQWRIGVTSIFAHALGIAPFKDTFWTQFTELGNTDYIYEKYPKLQTVVAILSTGPVAISDDVDGPIDIAKCCRADGVIMKPSKPATAIDAQIIQTAIGGESGPEAEIWSTYCQIGQYIFGVVMVTDLRKPYYLTPTAAFGPGFPTSKIFQRSSPNFPLNFTDVTPLILRDKCYLIQHLGYQSVCLFFTSPVFMYKGFEVFIYGEWIKWVPMSPQRIVSINPDEETGFDVTLTGVKGENVTFLYMVNNDVRYQNVEFKTDGDVTISLDIRELPPGDTTTVFGSAGQRKVSLMGLMMTVFATCFFLFL